MGYLNRFKDEILRDVSAVGGFLVFCIITIIFLVFSQYIIFMRLVIGFFVITLLIILIRIFYFKKRPKIIPYKGFAEKIDSSSFPSMHAARTSMLAVILISFFNNIILEIIIIVLLILVCLSRIMLKKHYLVDVFVGVVFGLAVGASVLYLI